MVWLAGIQIEDVLEENFHTTTLYFS